MKITEIEYQGDRATLTLDGEQKLDLYPDLRVPIDKKKTYRIISLGLDEGTGKLRIFLGIYRKEKQINCITLGISDFLEILNEHKLI